MSELTITIQFETKDDELVRAVEITAEAAVEILQRRLNAMQGVSGQVELTRSLSVV